MTDQTPKRAVLYARVSTDDSGKDGRNLDGQLAMCRDYAHQQGWQVVAELAEDDRGASGADRELPQLQMAIDMAEAGQYDVLVIRELDRLSRSLVKQLLVEDALKSAGVQIAYALADYPNTPEGSLNRNIRAVVAEYERLKIAERTKRGRRTFVAAGNVLVHGSPPYGYDLVEIDGKRTLQPNEQADIVKKIYSWYLGETGKAVGARIIAERLNDRNVPTYSQVRGMKRKTTGQWSTGTVVAILRNETYAGTWRYGKRGQGEDGQRIDNPADELLAVKVPALVDPDKWQLVQSKMDGYRGSGAGRPAKHKYLMSRRIFCDVCKRGAIGSPVKGRTGQIYLYYRCNCARLRAGCADQCTNTVSYPAGSVDNGVWQWVVKILTDDSVLQEGLATFRVEAESYRQQLETDLADLQADIDAADQELDLILDLYLAGDYPRAKLVDRQRELTEAIDRMAAERESLQQELLLQPADVDQFADDLVKFAWQVAIGIDNLTFEEAQAVIDALDITAWLWVDSDGVKWARVQGIIGEGETFSLSSDSSHSAARRSALRASGGWCPARRASAPTPLPRAYRIWTSA